MIKKVLITGSTKGIGFECAKYFMQNGFSVIAHYNNENDNLNTIKKNRMNECIHCDFNDDDAFNNFLQKVRSLGIEALVNNAGMYDFSKNKSNRIESIEKLLKVNVIAPVLLSEAVMDGMKKRNHGHIINISSIGAKYGSNINNIFYGVSKRGIESATKTLAKEGAKHNILVNTIRPGITNTDFVKNLGKDIKKRIELIPLKRAMEPVELAKFIFYMCTENTFITNEIITIAGGE